MNEPSDEWVLARSKEERRRGTDELRQRYSSLKTADRTERMGDDYFEIFGCNRCGDLTVNWCEGAGCEKRDLANWICNDCEDVKGFCRPCSKNRIAGQNPFPQEMLQRFGQEACRHCGKSASLQACSRCRRVKYCSVGCQKADWKLRHKVECFQKHEG